MSWGSALGFPLKVQHVDGTMASSAGPLWLHGAWLPGLRPEDSEWETAVLVRQGGPR